MQVGWATSTGHPDRVGHVNEDFVGAVADAVVVLDGAGIPGAEHLCRHGVAWYTRRLGTALLALLPDHPRPLADLLAEAIGAVADLHRDSCDVADTSSPQAAVAMVRLRDDHVDCLVLGDCTVLLAGSAPEPELLTDRREEVVRQECLEALAGMPVGSAAYDRALDGVRSAFRARRNTHGGFWVAKDDPAAAREAVVVTRATDGVTGVGLMTNGASRLVDSYHHARWGEVADVLAAEGPNALVSRLREVESDPQDGWEAPDDATVAWMAPTVPSVGTPAGATRLTR